VYAISWLILLFNCFACMLGCGIENYKAWGERNGKKPELA